MMADKDHEWVKEEAHKHRTGEEERRKGPRRSGDDRRDMIRFEPDKDDRRTKADRRGSKDNWGDNDKPI
ncbi:hypothetical protein [Methylophaga sp. OBS4]|uniref:hypothetical protein n=1 Tax=Methylophaga sp. OBS4 TaxID=2991935 RepID=UPI00224EE366|nr:hypothetical protein [Methylophaga sp. OBS4]MCX4187835.1 hypothetical protein [Methylophaga sp. OBS4]